MRKTFSIVAMLFVFCCTAFAQRHTDQLDRGLVAMPAASGNFVSWRRQADEYNNVTYNLYRGNTKIKSDLNVTNFKDTGGNLSSTYKVEAVVNGEKRMCDAVGLWNDYCYPLNNTHNGYLDIDLATVYDRDGNDVTSHYEPNDAEMADLDGDGDLEIIIKRLNTYDASTAQTGVIYPIESKEFLVFDAYNVNWQTGDASLMWRVDCGPNMVSLNSTEANIIAYDWDEDGKAEVVLRGADNMKVYGSDGLTVLFTVGNMSLNSRNTFSTTDGQYGWTTASAEYLIYMNGETGAKYQVIDFPLPRIEESEWNNLSVSVPYNDYAALKTAGYGNYLTKNTGVLHKAWGDNYGHRSSKYFMGAPVLDGRKASLFLGRGIYTRHKMIAMDLDKGSHQWSEKWRWNCNDSNSPWYGNGYHNFVIADVDEDGRDEIVYGSMVIDDNGKGLSTSGYEHGDAQHVGDFDPYRKGLEFFGCLEDGPYYGSDYRNATTSEVYYKHTGGSDDGRAIMGNFSNSYPGSQGRSVGSDLISSVKDVEVVSKDILDGTKENPNNGNALFWSHLNFRIFWDGDLRDEILDSPGTAKEPAVYDYESGRLFTDASYSCNMNNDSKNNPCFQGDIIGDWREEIVVRRGTGLRVYTTGMYTDYSMPCLWYDHQYRQAMVWQMMAYNQPPHVSYFVGEMEGITQAPPPLTNTGRTEIANGGSITSANTTPVMLCETNNMTVSVGAGAAPSTVFVNTPSWVQGTDVNGTTGTKEKTDGSVGATNLPAINTTTYTHTLTGNGFTGSTNLVKQGDGLLVLPNVTEAYTGKTDVWAGSLAFSGTLSSSPVWMNRHTKFFGAPTISNSLTMEYGSALYPSAAGVTNASAASYATANVNTLNMHEGSRMVIQMNPANNQSDQVNIGTLNLRTRSGDAWTNYGPEYLKPVIQIAASSNLGARKYTLGTLTALTVDGTPVVESKETPISSVVLEGAETGELYFYQGELVLFLEGASWEEVTETVVVNCDFNNGETLFTPVSRITVTNDNNAKFTCADNSQNGYTLATYDFSSAIGNDATAVKIEFLFWIPNENAAYRRFFTVGQANLRTGFGKNSYSTAGSMFAFGLARNSSANYFSINGASTTAAASAGNVLGAWARAEIYVDHSAKTVNYKITNVENTTTYYSANGVAFVDGSASYCNQLDFFDCQNNKISYLDNLVITKYVDQSKVATTYTVKYQNSEGTDLKEPAVYNTYVGDTYTATSSDMETFYSDDTNTKYIYLSGNATPKATSTAANNVITLVFDEYAKVAYTVTAKNGEETLGILASGDAYTDGSTTVYWSKYKQYDDKWYEATGSYGKTITAAGNTDVAYDSPANIAYFVEAEDMNKSRSAAATATGTQYSGGNAPRHYSSSQWWTDAIAEGGVYTLTFPYTMANASASTIVIKTRDAGGNYTATDLSLTASSAGTFSEEITIPAGSSVAICNENGYNSNILVDYLILTLVRPLSVSKSVTAAGWATYCSPYALDLANATGLTEAYIVTGASGNILNTTSVKGRTIPANTGILIKAPEGTVTFPVVASAESVSGNQLVGVTVDTQIAPHTGYVLMAEPSLGFYRNAITFTVGANTAYLPADFAGGGARSAFYFGDVTGIGQIENVELKNSLPAKRIVNGKLVIEKKGVKYNAAGAKLY